MLIYGLTDFNNQFSLFPTEGEIFQFDLSEIFSDRSFTCKIHPQVPYVELINKHQEIYRTKGRQFLSLASNNTHFFALSQDNEVFIYEWKNQNIYQVEKPIPIDPSFKCLNINQFLGFEILLDCYKNNQLFFFQIIDSQPKIANQSQSFLPISTKIKSIVNDSKTFLIYAQYFQNYSILTLISDNFKNLSCYSNQFNDFDTPNQINPYIYVITSKEIFQFFISSDFEFQLTFNFTTNNDNEQFTNIIVYENSKQYCDYILVLLQLSSPFGYKDVNQYFGCEYSIIYNNIGFNDDLDSSIEKIISNKQFIIYQLNMDIVKLSSIDDFIFQLYLEINHQSQLYINVDNELQFKKNIVVYYISQPKLKINLTNQIIEQYNYDFSLLCNNIRNTLFEEIIEHFFTYFEYIHINLQINLQILLQNDTNIYVMFNQDFPQDILQPDVLINFFSFSGQLLNYSPNQDKNLLNYKQATFKKIGEISEKFKLVQFIQGVLTNTQNIYIVGYNNYQLSILLCEIGEFDRSYLCITQNSIEIQINALSLKTAQSIYPEIIVIGLKDNNTIYLFKQNQNNNIYNQLNFTFEQEFSDFQVTYQNIIILIQKQEVQIMSLNFTNKFTINQQYINQHFQNIEFQPTQIVINTQTLSSFLFINNVHSVIIVSIDKNNLPIPISLLSAGIEIKQINLVNQQLILKSVLNVQNLPKFYYVKSLYSVNYDNHILISSDNLFFYITFSNHTLYIYNPILPQHMSLYYMVELTSPIKCNWAFYDHYNWQNYFDQSIILNNNSFYLLSENQAIEIFFQNEDQIFSNSTHYPQIIYNYSVTSIINSNVKFRFKKKNQIHITPNQSVTLFSNFTIFQPQNFKTVILTKENLNFQENNFTYPMSLILNRQIDYCGSTIDNETYKLSELCSLSYFASNSSKIPYSQNYQLITSINNQFFAFQNNQYISIFYDNLTKVANYTYSNLNLSDCIKSTSYDYTLYSICQNDSTQYWLIFQINQNGTLIILTNLKKLNQTFSNISKIHCILDQMLVLGSLNQQRQQLYWFNQSNNIFQQINKDPSNYGCKDFSGAQFLQDNLQQKQDSIIIFYIVEMKVFHRQMLVFGNSTIFIINPNEVILPDCFNQKCTQDEYFILSSHPLWILIIQVYYLNVIIFLSDFVSKIQQILKLNLSILSLNSFNYQEFFNFQNSFYTYQQSFGAVIKTLPNYGNSDNLGNSVYQNGVLMQQFKLKEQQNNENKYIVGTYYLNNLAENIDVTIPILMYGSFKTLSNQYGMIVNKKYRL
ncbi:unnamed protein product [Paramecium pentaurelia]|uniref:Uncharacterized protein n=1 Tax=Paramecium pentaurelia TaxID=43138 RepID=A0A8S1W5G1_9CILI|nr:unnamed protein product [Paramecium pentaurelia]